MPLSDYNRDVQRYALDTARRYRGCQQKMDQLQYMLNEMRREDGSYAEGNDYWEALLESLEIDMRYLEHEGKLSPKALARWQSLKRELADMHYYFHLIVD